MLFKLRRKLAIRKMTKAMTKMIGEEALGTFIAIMADSLENLLEGVNSRKIRTLEIKYNDYFSTKFDFEERKYVL